MSLSAKKKGTSNKRHTCKDVKQASHGAQRKHIDFRILAERNPSIMTVGAWVESVHEWQEHPNDLAVHTEELQTEILRKKELDLLRFQDAVRRRVSQQAQIRQKQQLQRSYETVEQDGRVLQQSSAAAQRLSPRRGPQLPCPPGELAICSPRARWVRAQEVDAGGDAHTNQQSPQVCKVVKLVRHRLAACQTVKEGDEMSELPGGLWKVSPTRDKQRAHTSREEEEDEENYKDSEEDEEISLMGQHDHPLCLQNLSSSKENRVKSVSFQNTEACERLLREAYPTGPCPGFSTDYRASKVLWPYQDQEELKKQRQSQFLTYRRLFMDVEREQVKEHQRHRTHLRRIARIKADKERQRQEEEQKLERLQQQEEERDALAEREHLILERLRLEEEERAKTVRRKEKAQKSREATRYIDALRAQMRERITQEKVDLPALCCCGDGFWDSHPDNCANNCVFYKNPKAYAQALQSVLLSYDQREGNAQHRASTRRLASMYAQSPQK
ncbi:coiled-coil domain-containing protein 15 [Sardina pilchardus]|uniref:coiled-coil domain-containing protein 15 n=1 Tax=Sardina pilchardus TaxID=27697 RepID=UPI002E0DB003